MTLDCGRDLAARGVPLLWVNRSRSRAEEAARSFGGEVRELEAFRRDPDPVEEPLYSSRRGYLEQLDHYKNFQGRGDMA